MKLSRASSYALHAVVYMASQEGTSTIASHHIAKAEGIPEKFLLKILKPLATARILVSLKGPNGGYKLARPANQITVQEVVEAVDGPIRGVAPLMEKGEGGSALDRRLEAICQQAAEQLRKDLGKVRIADLIGKDEKRK
jgi:Rrf2 family protein